MENSLYDRKQLIQDVIDRSIEYPEYVELLKQLNERFKPLKRK